MPAFGSILGKSNWEETQTQSILEGLHIPPGQGKTQDPTGTPWRCDQGEEREHYLAQPAHTTTVSPQESEDGWNCNVCVHHFAFTLSSDVQKDTGQHCENTVCPMGMGTIIYVQA